MKDGIRQNQVNFPENRKVAAVLMPGDRVTLAKYSGLSVYTIRDMTRGYRRMNDKFKQAFIRLMSERHNLDKTLDEIVNQ
jgi:hypothetical protein